MGLALTCTNRHQPDGRSTGSVQPLWTAESTQQAAQDRLPAEQQQQQPEMGSSVGRGPQAVLPRAKDELKGRLDRLIVSHSRGFTAEFETITSIPPAGVSAECFTKGNLNKNRYRNVVPYDFNRVKLSGKMDYINASIVESGSGEKPCWGFVAAQGPLRNTVEDFWRMALDQNCQAIVMLTKTFERQSEKCAPYFPQYTESSLVAGSIEVMVEKVDEISSDITIRRLRVSDKETRVVTTLDHYHYHEWPDHGVPQYTKPIRELINKLHSSSVSHPERKVIVHCSAGIGRTGSFCAIYILLQRIRYLQDLESPTADQITWAVDVNGVVSLLRRQRMGMVQTIDQYYFCYQAVIQDLEAQVEKLSS